MENLDDKSKRTKNSNRVTVRNEEIKLDRQDSRVEGVGWGSWGSAFIFRRAEEPEYSRPGSRTGQQACCSVGYSQMVCIQDPRMKAFVKGWQGRRQHESESSSRYLTSRQARTRRCLFRFESIFQKETKWNRTGRYGGRALFKKVSNQAIYEVVG